MSRPDIPLLQVYAPQISPLSCVCVSPHQRAHVYVFPNTSVPMCFTHQDFPPAVCRCASISPHHYTHVYSAPVCVPDTSARVYFPTVCVYYPTPLHECVCIIPHQCACVYTLVGVVFHTLCYPSRYVHLPPPVCMCVYYRHRCVCR